MFRNVVATAVERHPATQEARATSAEADAVVDEARERRLPSIDLSVSSYKVLSRDFSNDEQNIIERSRPNARTDAILNVNQTVFDFGASADRVLAAGARLRAAAAEAEASADRIALNTVASWYDVFAYRALVALSESFVANQRELREAVEERVDPGRLGAGRHGSGRFLPRLRPDPARGFPPAARQCRGPLYRADRIAAARLSRARPGPADPGPRPATPPRWPG